MTALFDSSRCRMTELRRDSFRLLPGRSKRASKECRDDVAPQERRHSLTSRGPSNSGSLSRVFRGSRACDACAGSVSCRRESRGCHPITVADRIGALSARRSPCDGESAGPPTRPSALTIASAGPCASASSGAPLAGRVQAVPGMEQLYGHDLGRAVACRYGCCGTCRHPCRGRR